LVIECDHFMSLWTLEKEQNSSQVFYSLTLNSISTNNYISAYILSSWETVMDYNINLDSTVQMHLIDWPAGSTCKFFPICFSSYAWFVDVCGVTKVQKVWQFSFLLCPTRLEACKYSWLVVAQAGLVTGAFSFCLACKSNFNLRFQFVRLSVQPFSSHKNWARFFISIGEVYKYVCVCVWLKRDTSDIQYKYNILDKNTTERKVRREFEQN